MPPQNLIQNHKISPREMYGQGLPLPWCLALVPLPLIPPKFFIADFQRYFLQITAYTPLSSPPKIFIADFQRYFLQNRKHFHATSPTSVE